MKPIHIIICLIYATISFGVAYIMTTHVIKDTDITTFLIILYGNIATLTLGELIVKHYK